MNRDKKDVTELSTRALLARRRALASRVGDVQQVLSGSLVEQTRRCGRARCRCAQGQPHGPYAYFSPRPAGGSRLRYVPAALTQVVARYLARGDEVEATLAQISAINAELLSRRELS